MMRSALLALMVVAAIPHLMLGGAGVARLAVQLPAARHRLDPVAFARFSSAADMGRGGFTLYPLLGIGGPLATLAALAVSYATSTPGSVRALLAVAALLCVLHSFTTSRAAPAMMGIGRAGDQAEVIAQLIDKFTWWSWPRAILQGLAGAVLMAALVALQGRGAYPVAALTVAFIALTLVTILAGAALDQVAVHIPAGRQIGARAYATYLRAADLANGRVLYPLVGLASNAALITTFGLALAQPLPLRYRVAFGVAAACGLAAFAVTARTLPAARALAAGPGPSDEAAVGRFVSGALARAPLFLIIFACLLWALTER